MLVAEFSITECKNILIKIGKIKKTHTNKKTSFYTCGGDVSSACLSMKRRSMSSPDGAGVPLITSITYANGLNVRGLLASYMNATHLSHVEF